jgi:hypothetical protein
MRTVTLDILDDKAVNLLRDLEALKIIRIQDDKEVTGRPIKDFAKKYSGSMTKQSIEEVDKQLRDLRNE